MCHLQWSAQDLCKSGTGKSRLIEALADDKDVDNKLLGNRQPEELDGEFARP
jgi:hypothetical protein